MKRSPMPPRKVPLTRTRFERRKHPKKRPPRGDSTGPGTTWAQVRLDAAERSGWHCERCGTNLRAAGLHGHHRKLRSQGGEDTIENCAALCPSCHTGGPDAVHRRPAQARARGFIVPEHHDPATWAVMLWDGRTVRFTTDGGYDQVWPEEDAA